MEHIEFIVDTVKKMDGKIDSIIERNGNADAIIATIKANQENHDRADTEMFKDIKKKQDGYDKFIRGTLIFLIIESVGIICAFAFGR